MISDDQGRGLQTGEIVTMLQVQLVEPFNAAAFQDFRHQNGWSYSNHWGKFTTSGRISGGTTVSHMFAVGHDLRQS